jgi:hypothetical protein
MADKKARRMDPETLSADQSSAKAVIELPDYRPAKADFTREIIQTKLAALQPLLDAEQHAQRVLDTARDNAVAAEWALHEIVLGAKEQVIAQYGSDSNEAQAAGLKKKSDYKKAGRKSKQ